MFAITCPVTGQRSLMGLSQVLAIRDEEHGIGVLVRCHCGRLAVLLTGRDQHEVLRHEAPSSVGDAA